MWERDVELTVQFGISTHLYHSHQLSEQHIREVAEFGFDRIELFAARGHFDYHSRSAVGDLSRWLDSSGVRLHSVHSPMVESLVRDDWGAAYNNATPDRAAREQAVNEALAAIEIASIVPYQYLILHLGVVSKTAAPENDREQAKRSVEKIHEAATKRGVRVALEVIPNDLSTPDSLVQLIDDELDLPDIGICLDFGHAFLMGDLSDAIETTAGHLVTTHVHDNRGKTDDHLAPFEGKIDWLTALMSVQKVGYEGTLLLELQSSEASKTVLERAATVRTRFDRILNEPMVPTEQDAEHLY